MSDNTQKDMLRKLLLRTKQKSRLWAALAALCVGTTLLLVSVMIWWNFNELLFGKNQNDSLGSTFLVIGKRVTDQNMGHSAATVFTEQDVADLRHVPQVEDVGLISANHFPVYATLGGKIDMATDLALEAVPDKFIDKLPTDWHWQPGQRSLPIIISTEFLNIYNYMFAPSQGLPQLSENSVKSIALNLKVGYGDRAEIFSAHVVGFSDRIGSVLAPQSFIDYGNSTYGHPEAQRAPSQLILKAKDPSDTKFGNYLREHDYTTNSRNLMWSKIRAIVEVVTSATGILALLLMGIGALVFILFIELTIARAEQSLTLLLQVGYSPRYLSKFMIARFVPKVLATSGVAAGVTVMVQFAASQFAVAKSLVLPLLPGWPVWAALVVSTAVLVLLLTRAISGAIRK